MKKHAILLILATIEFGFAKSNQNFEYAVARFKAAQNATVSRIQRKELAQAQKDLERFIDLNPQDARRSEAEGMVSEIKKELQVSDHALVEVSGIRFEKKADQVMIHVATTRAATWSVNHLGEDLKNNLPARVFIDLEKTSGVAEGAVPTVASNPFVKSLRVGRNTSDKTRIVFDLAQNLDATQYRAEALEGQIVLTLSSKNTKETKTPTVALTKLPDMAKANVEVIAKPATYKTTDKKGKLRIIIDAGHGGEDTGAIGPSGVKEKDITLQVSKRLQDKLSKDPKFEVLMTREDDTRLQLGDRTDYANQMAGDLFISIHANANPKPHAHGVSTYFLNNADDQESLRVAMRENGDLAPPPTQASSRLPDDYFLEVMKASMEKNFHTVQSTDLANEVQRVLLKQLGKMYSDINDLGVRSAGFYVLTGAKMPAILVETSFISNKVEEQRLTKDKYQNALAEAIYKAVVSYCKVKDKRNHASLSATHMVAN